MFLFDTGFGFGRPDLDTYYEVRNRSIIEALADAGIAPEEITALANCHLHVDHAGQNARFPGVPIYVQPPEWEVAHGPEEYTILATPGHSPGHQSIVVEQPDGPLLLVGQAVYSHGEWSGIAGAREGASRAMDGTAYVRSVEGLRALNPRRVLFGHDRQGWP